MKFIKSAFSPRHVTEGFFNNNVVNSTQIPHLVLNLAVAITTFVCSFLIIFVLIKYVIITTHVLEHLDNALELGVIRPINYNIANSIVESVSINSNVAVGSSSINSNVVVESASINSTVAVESTSINSTVAVESASINSNVVNSIVEVNNMSSSIVVESTTNNITPNTTTLLINSTPNHSVNPGLAFFPQSIESNPSVNNHLSTDSHYHDNGSTPIHRRIIIVYFIGAFVFLSFNAVVDTYLFVSPFLS